MLSPIGIAASAPLWVLSLVANEPTSYLGPRALVITLTLSTAGFLLMALVMLGAERMPALQRLRGPSAVIVVGLVVVVAAEARLTVLLAGYAATGLPDTVPLAARALSSGALALICYGYAGAALASWTRYRDERDRLLLTTFEAAQRVEGHEAAVSAMSLALRQSIQGRLREAQPEISRELDALAAAIETGGRGQNEFGRLRALTDARWRQISREAWSQLTPELPRINLREFAWAYALTRPYSILSLVAGAAAMGFFVFSRVLESGSALLSMGLWFTLALLVASLTNWLVRALPRIALGVTVLSLGAMAAFPVWLIALDVISVTQTEVIVRVAIINLHVIAILLLAGASPAIAQNREAVLAALRQRHDRTSLQQLQIESRLLGVARELAATLHGAARGTLMAATLRLEMALEQGDRERALELVEEVRAAIFRAESSIEGSGPKVTPDDLDRVLDNWRSICRVDLDGSWEEVPESLLGATHTVVVEAISDAMRHGDCSHLSIRVRSTGSGVDLSITNDGSPVSASAAPGLGSRLLDDLAPGRWRRDLDEDGRTRLTVSLGARPPA